MKMLPVLLPFWLSSLVCDANEVAQAIAENYGLGHWDKVESITYTFNVKLPQREISRTWTWEPRQDEVYSHQDDVKYNRREAINEKIDPGFINDMYWLLFPYHLVWDNGVKFEEEMGIKDPISGNPVNLLRVLYTTDDGYTPGDTYELYYDKNYTITAWGYRKGGSAEARIMSWEGNKTFNGITISTEHKSPEGVRLWFSDVAVNRK